MRFGHPYPSAIFLFGGIRLARLRDPELCVSSRRPFIIRHTIMRSQNLHLLTPGLLFPSLSFSRLTVSAFLFSHFIPNNFVRRPFGARHCSIPVRVFLFSFRRHRPFCVRDEPQSGGIDFLTGRRLLPRLSNRPTKRVAQQQFLVDKCRCVLVYFVLNLLVCVRHASNQPRDSDHLMNKQLISYQGKHGLSLLRNLYY